MKIHISKHILIQTFSNRETKNTGIHSRSHPPLKSPRARMCVFGLPASQIPSNYCSVGAVHDSLICSSDFVFSFNKNPCLGLFFILISLAWNFPYPFFAFLHQTTHRKPHHQPPRHDTCQSSESIFNSN